MKRILYLLFSAMFILTGYVYGQKDDVLQGVKRTDGEYANLFRLEFKPGKTDEGLKILKNTLLPAFDSVGVKITIMEDLMGTKDILLLIFLEEGTQFYEYIIPKQDIMLFNALVKQTGSELNAEKQLDEFINLLSLQSQTLVFVHDH